MSITYGLEECPEAQGDVKFCLLAAERALYVDGDLHAGRWWFDLAYRTAERLGDGPAMGRAAVGLGGVWVHEHRTAAEAAKTVARQRRALAACDPRSPLGIRLRARLCAEEDYRVGGHTSILQMLTEAREADDPVATAEALSLAHHCLMDPRHATLRLELAQGLIGQAAWTHRRGDLLVGLLWRTIDLFLGADPHAERSLRELRDQLSVEDHLAVGFVASAIDVMLAIRCGRFAYAETLAAECAMRGQAAGDADATGWYGAQMVAIRWYQGRIGELGPFLNELVHSPALGFADYAYLPALAVAAASAGDQRLARGMVARLSGPGLSELPRGKSWLVAMHGLVETAYLLDDPDTAAQVYDLLLPFSQLPMIASLGVACFGSTHLALGTASLVTGQVDKAVEHLRQAVPANLALGHWPAMVHSRRRLGQALVAQRGPRDAEAREELALAEREAAKLGMLLPETRTPGRVSRSGEPVAVVCRRHGREWRLAHGDRIAVVGDSVGMRHLATLLANPGREIRAVDLVTGPPPPGEGALDVDASSGQPRLDDQAKHAYQERLSRLRADIDELGSTGDPERVAALRAERDWLLAELKAATGLGGRARRFTDNQERARIAVGKAIRRALARIGESDPVIAGELRATVHTGLRCSYRPR